MPKQPVEARVLAAVAADDPPASADHLDDDEWHAAQDMWLVRWSSGAAACYRLACNGDVVCVSG